MSWKQYAASFFYFTPEVGPRLTSALFGEEVARSFDRSRPESFFQKALSGTGEVRKTALARNIGPRSAAVRVMAEHLPMMALLTLPFAYRGAFVQVGFNVRRVPGLLLYFTLLYSLFFVPALILLTVTPGQEEGPALAVPAAGPVFLRLPLPDHALHPALLGSADPGIHPRAGERNSERNRKKE